MAAHSPALGEGSWRTACTLLYPVTRLSVIQRSAPGAYTVPINTIAPGATSITENLRHPSWVGSLYVGSMELSDERRKSRRR